jgi:hypothetical protein
MGHQFQKRTFITAVTGNGDMQSEGDVQSHLNEMKKEWSKSAATHSHSHIKMLLKHTRDYRQDLLRKYPKGGVKPIMTEFPCYEEAAFVSVHFWLTSINILLLVITLVSK